MRSNKRKIPAESSTDGMIIRASAGSVARTAEEMSSATSIEVPGPACRSRWPGLFRWVPTSTSLIIDAEKRLLSLIKTGYVQKQVNIGSGPPGSMIRWFRSSSDEPRFINTVTFDSSWNSPTLVMVHGYDAFQRFFFRNFDVLARRFRVIAIEQLGGLGPWGPDLVNRYITARFGSHSTGATLTEEESKL